MKLEQREIIAIKASLASSLWTVASNGETFAYGGFPRKLLHYNTLTRCWETVNQETHPSEVF